MCLNGQRKFWQKCFISGPVVRYGVILVIPRCLTDLQGSIFRLDFWKELDIIYFNFILRIPVGLLAMVYTRTAFSTHRRRKLLPICWYISTKSVLQWQAGWLFQQVRDRESLSLQVHSYRLRLVIFLVHLRAIFTPKF